jgi:regulator of Ty1 transposition protein 103
LRQRLITKNSGGSVPEADYGTKESGNVPDSHRTSQHTPFSGVGSTSWLGNPFGETSLPPDETKPTKSAASVAAEVAAKLAASASSAQMLKSVLSSFVAEEASNSLLSDEAPPGTFVPDKRQRLNGPNEHIHNVNGSPSNPIHSAPMAQRQSMPFSHTPLAQQQQQQQQQQHQHLQQHHQPPQLQPQPQQQHHQTPQHSSNISSNMQVQLPPGLPPTILPQPQQPQPQPQQYMGQAQNVHRPSFGYGMPPPMPPMQRQVVVGMPSMPMQPQNPNPNQGPFQAAQPPIGYYGQPPLPTHLQQQ